MVSFEDIWDALKEDQPTSTVLDMINMTSDEEFDRLQPVDGVSYLCEAAVLYRCDIEVFKAICARTRIPHHLKKVWFGLTHLRAPKDFCIHLATEYLDKGLVTLEETQKWIERCIRGEHRIWFWKEVVDRQLARIADKKRLQKYFADEGYRLPVGARAYLRTALGMPEDFE